jgi:hypothetical protein
MMIYAREKGVDYTLRERVKYHERCKADGTALEPQTKGIPLQLTA